MQFKPDVVVYLMFKNDFDDNALAEQCLYNKPYFMGERQKTSWCCTTSRYLPRP